MIVDTTVDRILFAEHLRTPIGTLVVVTDERDQVRAVDWTDYADRMRQLLRLHGTWDGKPFEPRASRSTARTSLEAYFDGDRTAIDRVSAATGGTTFQQTVWRALRDIPCGQTRSYGQLAATIGKPRAVRAVGLANGSNAISLIIPCHRVIGASGSLTGYGGGLARKRWLLEFEGALTPALPDSRAAGGSLV